MKKKFFIFALMLMAASISFIVVSCSNDDDDIILPPIEGEGWQTTDATGSDDIILNFRLTKSDGTPANTFRYRENICFDLKVDNKTNGVILIQNQKRGDSGSQSDVIVGRNLFSVYDIGGEYVGRPFEEKTYEDGNLFIFTSTYPEIRLIVPSYTYDKEYPKDILNPYITGKWESMNALPPGDYYMECTLWYSPTKADKELMHKKEHTFKLYFRVC